MDRQQTTTGVALLRDGVDALLAADPSALSAAEITTLLADIEAVKRRLETVDSALIAAVTERGLDGDFGRTSPADLLVCLLRVTPAEARVRVSRAAELGPRRTLTGEPLPPLLPQTSAAVREGALSADHVAVIAKALDALPPNISTDGVAAAEGLLVHAARHEHPKQLMRTAQLLLARLDPDGLPPREDELARRRDFTLFKRTDGSYLARGALTPQLGAALQAVFAPLAAPAPADDGMRDTRSAGQRRHDALLDMCIRLLRSRDLPPAAGSPVTILARTTMAELAAASGVATSASGDVLSIEALLKSAGDAEIIPVVCDEAGGVLAYGRGRRLASRGQRLALAARDGGCSFPGCDRPAAWTEVHHVRPWNRGGTTDLDNMYLLCGYHHREHEARGWEVEMHDGVPHWLPPPCMDPLRRPMRNTAAHLADFDFDIDVGAHAA